MSISAVSLSYYPARLSDSGIDHLWQLALARVWRRSERLASLIDSVCCREAVRRQRLLAGIVEEVSIPRIDILSWTDSEIGQAARAATVLSYCIRDETAGKFCDQLAVFFVGEAARRLSKRAAI